MDKFKSNISVELPVTPEGVAELFCSMDGAELADFFNHIGQLVKSWDMGFIFQMQAVCDTENLNSDGKKIMQEIGNYSDGISWMQQRKIDQFISNIPEGGI